MSFKNKVVIVTGASSGIGAATAIEYAKEGANVALIGRNVEKLKKVSEQCDSTGNKSLLIRADITNDDDARRAVTQTVETFGKIDVLVNNAGIVRYGGLLKEDTMATYDLIMNTNLRAHFVMTHLAAPYLVKTKGSIINISSVSAKMVSKSIVYVCYGMSKAAVDHFTRIIALELAPYGVRVNSVSPGPCRSDLFINNGVNRSVEDGKVLTALGRVSDANEIANIILYLTSQKAVGITGSDYLIDNGMLLNRE